jgi:ornithine carbamoyltransferase
MKDVTDDLNEVSVATTDDARRPRHFLDIRDLDAATLRDILTTAEVCKAHRRDHARPLTGKSVALIFGKPSTRTRVSFEVAIREMGGDPVVLLGHEMQLGRGETIADTARVLSRYVDAIMLRTDRASNLHELAQFATVPVINGLTEASHPCQIMADILTFEELRGPIAGQTIAWVGDGNNVARSWIEAAARFNFTLRLACPAELEPPAAILAWAKTEGAKVEVVRDPRDAVRDARCVITDTWVSMSDPEGESRHNMLARYQVTTKLMAEAAPDAIFMHCLPAHRGEEVEAAVIDGPQSVVFQEAENRLHAQKGVLAWVFEADGTA